ncbi:hypothetical protein [Halopiger djelfimassiliensis]|uniref:hypothetical protein n=1 Tax=Halopiger djelfimassiliensis TaxID=1293047 RepID=UPI0006779495|nr:hypothetical protein [Halopiger djelfimassiliensis]
MGERELTAVVEGTTAAYDHEGTLESVDIRLTYETTLETNAGKKRVTYGAPRFRFAVDPDGCARLAEIESRDPDGTRDASAGGVSLADFRALPAAVELLEEIGDVSRVEPVERSVADRIDEIGAVEFEAE